MERLQLTRCLIACLVVGCNAHGGAVPLHQVGWDTFTLAAMPVTPAPAPAPLEAEPSASDQKKFETLLGALRQQLMAAHVPGASAAVVVDGRLA